MRFMLTFGWVSVMLCMGLFFRAQIPFLQNMLVPSSVIAGVLGAIFINMASFYKWDIGTDTKLLTDIINHLFTISFISISLTDISTKTENSAKEVLRGALGLGTVWCFLYALTPVIGMGVMSLFEKSVHIDKIYGILVPFAFCQGPGQSASYGTLFEQFGWKDATMVAMTYSIVGFVVAFLLGVFIAKFGVKKGLAKHCGRIDKSILKGYRNEHEQVRIKIKDSTCSSNIETLSFYFAIIGICYIMAVGIAKILSNLPGFLGESMSSMMFMNGMYAAYIIKWIIKKLKLNFLLDRTLQNKITGLTSDYLVVCAFMSVSISMIYNWFLPMFIVCLVITVVTFFVCLYFGQRFGGENDFERTLGLYGMCTGTVPSGIALVRIVDPNFETSTSVELGACNLVMMVSTPVYLIILAYASGTVNKMIAVSGLLFCSLIYLVILKMTKVWGEKTFQWK